MKKVVFVPHFFNVDHVVIDPAGAEFGGLHVQKSSWILFDGIFVSLDSLHWGTALSPDKFGTIFAFFSKNNTTLVTKVGCIL